MNSSKAKKIDNELPSRSGRIYEKLTPDERERVVQEAKRALDFE